MSIAGIASSVFSQLSSLQSNKTQQSSIPNEFQQLSQDLQSGNLSAAKTDYATLQQNLPAGFSSSGTPAAQAFSALGQDLQSGNLSGAQQAFSTVQQDVQQSAGAHHHGGGSSSSSTQQPDSITQLFSTLGQDLQGSNLSGAQSAYSSLSQDLPFLSDSSTAMPGVSFTA